MAKADPERKIVDAALRLLAKTRWSDLTLAEVARSARVPLTSLRPIVPDKTALFGSILGRFAAETGRRYRPDPKNGDVHDRLLDVCLTLFETMAARKPAVRSLYQGVSRNPVALIAARKEILAAAAWFLVLAEADCGPSPYVRKLALTGIVARALPVWLNDNRTLSRTMAQLDKDLRNSAFVFARGRAAAN